MADINTGTSEEAASSSENQWYERQVTQVTTGDELRECLAAMLEPTDSCIIHTRMSAFGFIPGSAMTVVNALKSVVSHGTIVMPTQSADWSDPADWGYPSVAPALLDKVREGIPPFDRDLTPCSGMGAVPEYFRTLDSTVRSSHPLYSFAAWGSAAQEVCADGEADDEHRFDVPFGSNSPLRKLYDVDAKVVMLGTGYDKCTALHLAESTIGRSLGSESAKVRDEQGRAVWVRFAQPELEPYDDFNEFGEQFEREHPDAVSTAMLGSGTVRVVSMRVMVDAARDYWKAKDAHRLQRESV